MAPGKLAFKQTLTESNGTYTFIVTPDQGSSSFATVNNNGSQRGGRPFIQFLPKRLKNAKIQESRNLKAIVSDDFILAERPKNCDPALEYKVVFTAEIAE